MRGVSQQRIREESYRRELREEEESWVLEGRVPHIIFLLIQLVTS